MILLFIFMLLPVLFLVLAVTFFVLWVSKKPSEEQVAGQRRVGYDEGYRDGWAALAARLEAEAEEGVPPPSSLKRYAPPQAAPPDHRGPSRPTPTPQPDWTVQQPDWLPPQLGQPAPGQAWLAPPPHPFPQQAWVQPHPQGVQQTQGPPYSQGPPQVQVPSASYPPPPPESPEKQKERRTLRNLNIMLYVASFLMVGAAAGFVFSSTPAPVRLAALWVVAGLFYGGGFGLYFSNAKLRPAAVSFVGTGLAILPFAGLALNALAGVPPSIAWLLTSLVGLAAYLLAALLLKKSILAYITLAFVISLTLASVDALQLPLAWWFVSAMTLALLARLVAIFFPKAVPQLFAAPFEYASQLITPVALFAALMVIGRMSLASYVLVFSVATLQYVIFWIERRTYLNETIPRVLALITFSLLGWQLADGQAGVFVGVWMGALMTFNAVYSLVRVRLNKPVSLYSEAGWIAFSLLNLLLGGWLWTAFDQLALGLVIYLYLAIAVSVGAIYRFRWQEWGYAALMASLPLPMAIAGLLPQIPWIPDTYQWLFLAVALISLWLLYRYAASPLAWVRHLITVAFWVYLSAGTVAAYVRQVDLGHIDGN